MDVTNYENGVSSFGQVLDGGAITTPGKKWYVSRNVSGSLDGKSWNTAFKTIQEAITRVNADYTTSASPSKGRNVIIYIAEGWYAETPSTLTASDVSIIVVSPGNHDSTVLYGVPVADVFSGTAGGPALTVTGSNNTIYGLKGFTSDPLFPFIVNGALSATDQTTGNAFINCGVVRDVDNGCLGGILDYGADGTLIKNFEGSTSCKDYTIQVETNGVINPVNCQIIGGRSVGVPTPIDANAGHNTVVDGHTMIDDTSDRPGAVTVPVAAAGSTNLIVMNCYSEFSNANVVTGGTSTLAINNFLLASPA